VFVMVCIVRLDNLPLASRRLARTTRSEGSRPLTRFLANLITFFMLAHFYHSGRSLTVWGRSAIHSTVVSSHLTSQPGISTSAGIPDFRSPKTGKYSHGPMSSRRAWNEYMDRSSLTSLSAARDGYCRSIRTSPLSTSCHCPIFRVSLHETNTRLVPFISLDGCYVTISPASRLILHV